MDKLVRLVIFHPPRYSPPVRADTLGGSAELSGPSAAFRRSGRHFRYRYDIL